METQTQTQTKAVVGTKLILATAALFLAAGSAFAVAPMTKSKSAKSSYGTNYTKVVFCQNIKDGVRVKYTKKGKVFEKKNWCHNEGNGLKEYYRVCKTPNVLSEKITPCGCSDSDYNSPDGENHTLGQTVYNGNNYNDTCLDENNLREYGCSGLNLTNDTVNCEYGCEIGACRKTLPPTCSDGDNGIDYTVRAPIYTTDEYGVARIGFDNCINIPGNNFDGYLQENYCDEGLVDITLYDCPNGCFNGACIEETTTTIHSCTDTDGGFNVYEQGTATLGGPSPSSVTDQCGGFPDVLVEYHCASPTHVSSTFYTCPNSECFNGACLATSTPNTTTTTCFDTDGGINYEVPGIVNGMASNGIGFNMPDYCNNDVTSSPQYGQLKEHYCNDQNREPEFTYHTCPNGCGNNACISTSTTSSLPY